MLKKTSIAVVLSATLAASSAQAAVLWAFEEVGGDVIGTLSGSLDMTGMVIEGTRMRSSTGILRPAAGILYTFNASPGSIAVKWEGMSGPSSFGTGLGGELGTYSGTPLGLDFANGDIWVDSLRNPISGVYTIEGVTLASLGITPGTYTYTVPSDTITLRFTPMSAVPLPGGLALLAGALGLIGLNRCRASARS